MDVSASGERRAHGARDARRWSEAPHSSGRPKSRDGPPAVAFPHLGPTPHVAGDVSVTLIRRDPATGEQWNVGRVALHGARRDGGAEVALELHTPGYAKFGSALPDPSAEGQQPLFCRRLGLRAKTPPSPTKAGLRARAGNASPSSTSPASPTGLPPLAFASPWHGTCSFATTVSGRALVCRHARPPPSPASPAALKPADVVSELRPHLPGRGLFSLAPSSERSRPFSTLLPSPRPHERAGHAPDDSDADEDGVPDPERLDLSLGRERAGGGARGRTAKLGKLVVAAGGPGAAMLDLLVAANMGVWWSLATRDG